MMSVHAKQRQMVKISEALHYDVSRNYVVVLEWKTPDIIIQLLLNNAGGESSWSVTLLRQITARGRNA